MRLGSVALMAAERGPTPGSALRNATPSRYAAPSARASNLQKRARKPLRPLRADAIHLSHLLIVRLCDLVCRLDERDQRMIGA